MLYSLLSDKNMNYVSMHAECALHTYSSEFCDDDSISDVRKTKGIYCKTVNSEILSIVSTYKFGEGDLCIDFTGIEEISENSFHDFLRNLKDMFCSRNKAVFFLNLNEKIYRNMGCGDMFDLIDQKEHVVSVRIGKTKYAVNCTELVMRRRELYNESLERVIQEVTEDNIGKCHASVPVYLTKYINIKKLVELKPEFFRYLIYELATKMIEKDIVSANSMENANCSFFFHTINGGYIATQLAELFQMDMAYLDHLGPIESVHRKHFEKSIRDNQNYIIVSDVICLGGEVGRARTIIEYCGGKVKGEVCIVDIRTVGQAALNKRISLYTVSSEHNNIDYMIRTDMCDWCRKEDR